MSTISYRTCFRVSKYNLTIPRFLFTNISYKDFITKHRWPKLSNNIVILKVIQIRKYLYKEISYSAWSDDTPCESDLHKHITYTHWNTISLPWFKMACLVNIYLSNPKFNYTYSLLIQMNRVRISHILSLLNPSYPNGLISNLAS